MNERLAASKVLALSGLPRECWNVSTDPVCGLGEEYFFTLKADPNRFFYVCVEDGVITACETN